MQKKLSLVVASVVLLGLSGCGLFLKKWTRQKLERYEIILGGERRTGRAALRSCNQLFEKLESSYPFGNYAQQAQMEIAYAYYKSQTRLRHWQRSSASSSCTRITPMSIICTTCAA
jgi:outer membrane protein assembly factor BamD